MNDESPADAAAYIVNFMEKRVANAKDEASEVAYNLVKRIGGENFKTLILHTIKKSATRSVAVGLKSLIQGVEDKEQRSAFNTKYSELVRDLVLPIMYKYAQRNLKWEELLHGLLRSKEMKKMEKLEIREKEIRAGRRHPEAFALDRASSSEEEEEEEEIEIFFDEEYEEDPVPGTKKRKRVIDLFDE